MTDKLILTGYVSVRQFGGYALPVPIQNKLLRIYCNENDFIYKLPLNETCLQENFMFLFSTVNSASNKSNIGMCSIHMFPRNKTKFELLLKKIIDKKLNFHFIFENSVISSNEFRTFYLNSQLRYLENTDLEIFSDDRK